MGISRVEGMRLLGSEEEPMKADFLAFAGQKNGPLLEVVFVDVERGPEDSMAALGRAEKKAARSAAARLLQRMGSRSFEVGRGSSGEPLWPAGFTGSVSHSQGRVLLGIGRSDSYEGIGIDLEVAEALPPETWDLVFTGDEIDFLAALTPGALRESWALLLFSAKESVYKCQFPLTSRFIDYSEVTIVADPSGFSVRAAADVAEEVEGCLSEIRGCFGTWRGSVATLAWKGVSHTLGSSACR